MVKISNAVEESRGYEKREPMIAQNEKCNIEKGDRKVGPLPIFDSLRSCIVELAKRTLPRHRQFILMVLI